MSEYDKNWAQTDINQIPEIIIKPPGPKSIAIKKRAGKYMLRVFITG